MLSLNLNIALLALTGLTDRHKRYHALVINMPLQFDCPAGLTAEKFIVKLSNKACTHLVFRHYSLKTYYDSFDWWLYSNGIACEVNRSKVASTLLKLQGRKPNLVQENTLKEFSEEIRNNNIHAYTLLAMGVLIQNLDTLRGDTREDFSAKFATFKHEENPTAIKSLLAAKD